MSRKKEPETEKENSERWLLTYSDLITLLMIFFVVLYSISKVDANKFQAIAESLSKALGGGIPAKIDIADNPSGPKIMASGTPNNQSNTSTPQNNQTSSSAQTQLSGAQQGQGNAYQDNMTIEGIKAKLDKFAADNGIQTRLVSSIEERGLVVSIEDTLLFESGSADITPKAKEILKKISTVLAAAPNFIRVEGHTDNLPIHTSEFPSNWELSVIRATNVVQILATDGGIAPDRLSATGYGEYRPIASNNTDAGRAQNRRVDLIILRSKYELTEPPPAPADNPQAAPSSH